MPLAILQKAIDELNQPKPRLDYIRGLLETLAEIQPKPVVITPSASLPPSIRAPIKIGKTTIEPQPDA